MCIEDLHVKTDQILSTRGARIQAAMCVLCKNGRSVRSFRDGRNVKKALVFVQNRLGVRCCERRESDAASPALGCLWKVRASELR